MAGVGGVVGGKWRQLYSNNNKKNRVGILILGEKSLNESFGLSAHATSLILNGVSQLSLIAVSVTTMVSSKLQY